MFCVVVLASRLCMCLCVCLTSVRMCPFVMWLFDCLCYVVECFDLCDCCLCYTFIFYCVVCVRLVVVYVVYVSCFVCIIVLLCACVHCRCLNGMCCRVALLVIAALYVLCSLVVMLS